MYLTANIRRFSRVLEQELHGTAVREGVYNITYPPTCCIITSAPPPSTPVSVATTLPTQQPQRQQCLPAELLVAPVLALSQSTIQSSIT
jgi:hypothetical protein